MAQRDLTEARQRAKRVKLVAHDVHGVMTDNTFFVDVEGRRRYQFLHQDGFGHLSFKRLGIEVAVIDTTSIDEEGLYRMRELKMEENYYRVEDKGAKLKEVQQRLGISPEETCWIGCDITDLPIMEGVGFAVAPADALEEVREVAHYVTEAPGGRGVLREVCEFILKAQGRWDQWVKEVAKMGYK